MGTITWEMTAETAGFVRGCLSAAEKLQRVKQAGDRAGRSARSAFGPSILKQLKGYATGWVSVGAAIAAVVSGLKAAAAADKAFRGNRARELEGAETALRRLGQLPGGRRQLAADIAGTKRSAREGPMSLAEAARLQFSLGSFSKRSQRGLYASVSRMLDTESGETPSQIANTVGTLQSALGRRETGGDRAVINKILAASARTKVGIADLGVGSTLAAKTAAQRGTTDEELLAAMAVLTRGLKSPELAGQRIQQFMAAAGKRGLPGQGILGTARALEARGLGEQQLRQLLPKRAYEGYLNVIQSAGAIGDVTRAVGAAGAGTGKGDMLDRQLAAIGSNPTLAALRRRRAVKRPGMTALGVETLNRETARELIRNEIAGDETSGFRRHMAAMAGSYMDNPLGSFFAGVLDDTGVAKNIARIAESLAGGRPSAAQLDAHIEGAP